MRKNVILAILTFSIISLIVGCGIGGGKDKVDKGKVLEHIEKTEVLNVAFEGTYPPF